MNCDIAIVGAGPAGSTAAYVLAQKGLDVVLIDKQSFPRPKLCGGCLTVKTLKLLDRLYRQTEESLTRQGVIDFKSTRFQVRFRTETLVDHTANLPFYFVDRSIYDAFLLRQAKEAGAGVMENRKVIDFQETPGRRFALTLCPPRNPRRRQTVNASFIIGADGVNSIIRTRLFRRVKPAVNWRRDLAHCLEISAPRGGIPQSIDYPILSFGYLRTGYAWIFPNKNKLVIGMGGLHRKDRNLAAAFDAFTTDFNIERTGSVALNGHPLPYGNFIKKPVWQNLLLVGDAAGLVDPVIGEGIYPAHKSGELAARAIIQKIESGADLEEVYPRLLNTHLLPEFIHLRRWRWLLHNPLNRCSGYRCLKAAAPRFGELLEAVHGMRGFRWLKPAPIHGEDLY
jgi:geranylgeranyl reductase family protein